MLERTDRVLLAVPECDSVIETYGRLFDAAVINDQTDGEANARRVTLQWGRDQLEALAPLGPGPVADFLSEGRRGLFAGGFSLRDPASLAAHLEGEGVRVHEQGLDRFVVFPADLGGTGVVLTRREERERVGLIDRIWQISFAVPQLEPAVERYARLLRLGGVFTHRYSSELYGYDAAVTWLDARPGGMLDSLEYVEPVDQGKAIGRFVDRGGPGIYMISVGTDQVDEIRKRVTSTGPGWDGGSGSADFIHPLRLHGLLLGVGSFERMGATRPLPGDESTN